VPEVGPAGAQRDPLSSADDRLIEPEGGSLRVVTWGDEIALGGHHDRQRLPSPGAHSRERLVQPIS
jgi:hypothetical protein